MALGLTAVTAPQAMGEVVYRESMRDYELRGTLTTSQDIWRAIRKYGKTETNATSIRVGWANWRIGMSYESMRRGNLCSIANVKVKVDVLINVPQWQDQRSAKRHLRRFFTCVRRTVTTHEIRHGEIARETGKKIERAYWDWLVDIPCDQFQDRANEIFERETKRGKQAQAAFDEQDYARNRYRVCDKLGTGAEVAAYMPAEVNHPRRRTLKSGRPWVERRQEVADARDDETASVVPAATNGDTPEPPQSTPSPDGDDNEPRRPAATPDPESPGTGLLADLPPELRSSLFERLSGILAICTLIGVAVWYATKRLKKAVPDKKPGSKFGRAAAEASADHEPTWAIQAAAALNAKMQAEASAAPEASGSAPTVKAAPGRKPRPSGPTPRQTQTPAFGKRNRAVGG
jgi:predicted secreted Zn-dependent protease